MNQYFKNLVEESYKKIQKIEQMDNNVIEQSVKIISVLEETCDELKKNAITWSFENKSEEILFFKEIKPQIFSLLIYYNKIYDVEIRMPNGTLKDKKTYLENILGRIKYFFETNFDFYHYYRSKCTYLDNYYFLRGRSDIQFFLDSFYFEKDARFTTSHDSIASKILAYERLAKYINDRLLDLDESKYTIDTNKVLPKVRLTWTGKKTELVELIYSWDSAKCFNNGNTNIKEVAQYIECIFNINLGDYYHIFLEIRERKGRRTLFLDNLIKFLNDRMDNLDNK